MELKVIELNATRVAGENKMLGKYFWANTAGFCRKLIIFTDK